MAARKTPPRLGAEGSKESGFAAWQKSKRGDQVAAALAWRKAYQTAIDAQSATALVMKMLLDGQSKERSLWKYLTDADHKPFTSFAAFCAAALPLGLGTPVDELRRRRRVFAFNGRD